MQNRQAWIWLYALLLLLTIIGTMTSAWYLFAICKSMLMPALFLGVWMNKKRSLQRNWKIAATALLLSWAGDVLLLFESRNNLFFIGGLAAFLAAHICYILYFYRYSKNVRSLQRRPVLAFIIISYAVALFILLMPYLGKMLVPVAVYTLVITIMMLSSLNCQLTIRFPANRFLLFGALAFILSDSALAVNKFYKPYPMAAVIIMLTYGIAQLLICAGVIINNDDMLRPPEHHISAA